ncbi:3-isopropylmalate dehydratase [Candidatus Roizmanbacteria bacterium CG_4_9_14_3_um_filter_33_18]|uniref:3-isopropylmalate dehydratase n=3 Tax=Candidatus Roizmaniibacteriota TaxID=1752723 RepID=A0A2M7U8E8_9BACT|nr:MAG: 3-isopropylmalate dehydratase [Candidatus Roizmanbacteria bacterium CG22_combo_CG10-13_8_21_14_all_34_12]PIZ67510.1 MAG: 3-isopropylmalate dehydratase [Candidatus Roizmanbacteria bacterium CG_4_10_14_0_2_um_filter_33_96]PJA56029.1 MAG: 3-isopropylmalate dehydratase [Candidatus Roizmanbacteria bacterium CG_4_9_14_3_um_filter_33_18]
MNWIFGNNINTDLITPGRYNITTDAKELAKIAFIEHRPNFAKTVKKDDFIIAGNNFGCGSSRETAVTALKACGIKAIIAKSFARIFYRNCINQGLLAIVGETKNIGPNDKIKIDIKNVPPLMTKLYETGGIIPYLKKNGLDSLKKLFLKT